MKRTVYAFTAILILLAAMLPTSLSFTAFSVDNSLDFKYAEVIESDIIYNIKVESGESAICAFIAPEDGYYLFEAIGGTEYETSLFTRYYEPVATLYDDNGNELQYVEFDHYYPDIKGTAPYTKFVQKMSEGEKCYYKTNLLDYDKIGNYYIRVMKAPDLVFTYEAQDEISGVYRLFSYTGNSKEFTINSRYTLTRSESLYIPKENVILDGIDMLAFEGNEYLETINLPYDLSYIASEAFLNCKKLSTVNLGRNTKKIGYRAFAGCESLKSITIESNSISLDTQCLGFDENGNKYDDFTIYCFKNSTAEKYAKANGISYSIITVEPATPKTNSTSPSDISDPDDRYPTTSPNQKTSADISSTQDNKVVVPKVKKAKIKKIIKTSNKRRLKVIWKKISGVSGYQIKCGLNRKMTKGKKVVFSKANKKSKIIKIFKSKKRYYVKVRAYKTYISLNGETLRAYGKWSKIKRAKTR